MIQKLLCVFFLLLLFVRAGLDEILLLLKANIYEFLIFSKNIENKKKVVALLIILWIITAHFIDLILLLTINNSNYF